MSNTSWMTLAPGHVIRVMYEEHEVILATLTALEAASRDLEAASPEASGPVFKRIAGLAQRLCDAESHHEREEKVLFPALEDVGIDGPTAVMREEHVELRAAKHDILEMARAADANAREALCRRCLWIVHSLRDHISKENVILYPEALEAIPDASQWDEMKSRAEAIGYCPFTPRW
ncbi:MAG: hemerythrin domain-containing protein [Planctomycetota bacterium]